MIRRDEGQQDEISFFIHDLDLRNADLMSLRIGRFYDRHPNYLGEHNVPDVADVKVGDCLCSWDAAGLVENWTRGAFIVGAVPNFDTEVLARLLRKNGFLEAWHYHLRDIEAMAIGYLAGQGLEFIPGADWKSDDLSKACGVEPPNDEERHTALGDARWVMRWYDAIMGARE
jgi:hypothetical protein